MQGALSADSSIETIVVGFGHVNVHYASLVFTKYAE
jgi:hypothetical protein